MSYAGFLTSKTLPDGTLLIAVEYGSSVILVHQILTGMQISLQPPRRFSYRWPGSDENDLDVKLETDTLRTLLISRADFDAGGYENKVYAKNALPAPLPALPAPEH